MSYADDFMKNMEEYEKDKEYRLYGLQMYINEDICERLEQLKMTTKDLAKKLQISQCLMNRYMSGEKIYSLDILVDICLTLGLDAKMVFSIKQEKDKQEEVVADDNTHHMTS